MAESAAQREREKAWFAIWLAGVAGFVNAIGYLLLFRLGVSHMTGNAVQTGLAGSHADWSTALVWLLPVPLFIGGLLLSLLAQEVARRLKFRSVFAVILGIEAALLVAFLVCANVIAPGVQVNSAHGAGFILLVALVSVAMGMQTATVHNVRGQPVRTTYVTGVLSNFAEEAMAAAVSAYDVLHARLHAPRAAVSSHTPEDNPRLDRAALKRALLLGAVWVAFVAGALAGAYAEFRWAVIALVFPLASLLCLIAADLVWPAEAPPRDPSHRRAS